MEVAETRPKLVSFRALAFHGENRSPATGGDQWLVEMTQTIEVGLAVPTVPGGILQAVVKILLSATAKSETRPDQKAEFTADYKAKYDYPRSVVEADVLPLTEQEPYQYVLVAQAFPLAMTHFRREMQSMGFDGRKLPLGI